MIVYDSWWSNGSARSTIIDYHEPFDQGLNVAEVGHFTLLGSLRNHDGDAEDNVD